jgi:cytidine deaminase
MDRGRRNVKLDAKRVLADLVAEARAVRGNAYAPYSEYKVGAALVTESGAVFTGCNVENASYGGTICAERSAICAMIAAGERAPVAIAVATGGATPGSPCGICRQVLREFARDIPVALVAEDAKGRVRRRDTTLAKLLPDAFDGSALTKGPKRRPV